MFEGTLAAKIEHKIFQYFNKTAKTMKKLFPLIILLATLASCGPEKPKQENTDEGSYETAEAPQEAKKENDGKGIGQVKEVKLNTPLEQERIPRGQAIYEMKCQACHRLDATRVVGPGWKDVTKRRKPEWIMNMVTNVDVMLEQDEEAQKLLELCLTRMPNQNVSVGDARDVLEFMRQNDGEK
jgi:mono/diheme cytochrome c family protein